MILKQVTALKKKKNSKYIQQTNISMHHLPAHANAFVSLNTTNPNDKGGTTIFWLDCSSLGDKWGKSPFTKSIT